MQIEQLNSMTKARLMVLDANAAVQVAALSLSKPGIGLVVVCDDNGAAAGVLSKSDLIRHLTGAGSPTPPASAAQCMDFHRVQSGRGGTRLLR
ncbi:CBS domain-containing protein [Mesorhizobium sp. M0816]|uniref:CBS domain-containing protein n=1 Tax=Mesorhizobium sp. M0816 TaxID=2957006 RepID=UPI0033389DDA